MAETTTALPVLTLGVTPGAKLLTANQRGNWRKWAPWTKYWRLMSATHATNRIRAGAWPRLERAHITITIDWPDKRRRDPTNWANTGKALVDGLVDAGLLPDDDTKHVIGPDMRSGYGPHTIHIHIQPLDAAP